MSTQPTAAPVTPAATPRPLPGSPADAEPRAQAPGRATHSAQDLLEPRGRAPAPSGAQPTSTGPAPTAPGQRAPMPSGPPASEARLRIVLAALERDLQRRGFSGSILVAQGDELLLDRGFGFADPTTRARNDAQTRFDVASVTKQFTAAAILRLAEQGKLGLDDPVSRWVDVPEERRDVTLRDLLTHRSGLGYPAELERWDFERLSNDPRALFSRFMHEAAREGPRGEHFSYNNFTYSLLAYVVQEASGTSYERYLREHLFAPAGMRETSFDGLADTPPQHAAVGREGRQPTGPAGYLFSGWGSRGATGIVSTTHDLLRWSRAVQSDRVLSASSRELLFQAPAPPSPDGDYALGWMVERDAAGRLTVAQHSGSTAGFLSQYTLLPRDGVTIVVLANQSGVPDLVYDTERRIREAVGR